MAKNGQKNTKRNHRAHKMADFTENCVYFGPKDGAIAPDLGSGCGPVEVVWCGPCVWHICPWQMRPWQIRPWLIRPLQIRPWQIRPWPIRPWPIRPWQIRPWQIRPWPIRPWPIRPWPNRPWPIRPWQIRPWQIRPWQIRPWEIKLSSLSSERSELRLRKALSILPLVRPRQMFKVDPRFAPLKPIQ